jgi:uncharacterized ion transporter superfamily protein YfcC
MGEEVLVFYPVMISLFLAAGYDLLVPLDVIFAGTQLGTLSPFTYPFSTIIASNAAGVNRTNGLTERIIMLLISTAITIWYFVHYGQKVKKDPLSSIVYRVDGNSASPFEKLEIAERNQTLLSAKSKLLLTVFLFIFLVMIGGVA